MKLTTDSGASPALERSRCSAPTGLALTQRTARVFRATIPADQKP